MAKFQGIKIRENAMVYILEIISLADFRHLGLLCDLAEVIKLIGETFEPKNIFFQKSTLCHSFRIIVIPSVLLSFLPDYCHSFHIIVIPSLLVSFLPNTKEKYNL